MTFDAHAHNAAVIAFLREAERDDPERFDQVCHDHPTLTRHGWKQVRRREMNVGLLGIQPIEQGRLATRYVHRYQVDVIQSEES